MARMTQPADMNGGLTTVIGPGFTAISGNGGSGPLLTVILTARPTAGVATVSGPSVLTILPTATATADAQETDAADAADATQMNTDAAPQTTPAPTTEPGHHCSVGD
ncbi:hypothetical protein A4X09_0g7673 [Tilletia walkeri]|uniref:Uncharacterized protein n=1 Tax=Tilletia walkeri TaxID=117179 RepID=A0A8X7T1V1_9BASI|nr:hypothetical protein A4X09_0g7673 [Tilletia walkeri]